MSKKTTPFNLSNLVKVLEWNAKQFIENHAIDDTCIESKVESFILKYISEYDFLGTKLLSSSSNKATVLVLFKDPTDLIELCLDFRLEGKTEKTFHVEIGVKAI